MLAKVSRERTHFSLIGMTIYFLSKRLNFLVHFSTRKYGVLSTSKRGEVSEVELFRRTDPAAYKTLLVLSSLTCFPEESFL